MNALTKPSISAGECDRLSRRFTLARHRWMNTPARGEDRVTACYRRLLNRPTPLIWIASVSKSGNTWVRYLLANALFGPVTEAGQPERALPHWYDLLNAVEQGTVHESPRTGAVLVKTHEQPMVDRTGVLQFLMPLSVGAIYIYRNPADVCLSQIHHMRLVGQHRERTDRELAYDFVAGRLFPDEGPWTSHVAAWRGVTQFPVLWVGYEELHAAPVATLTRMLTFIGESASSDVVRAAVMRSDFASMRMLEDAQGGGLGYLTPDGDPTRRFVNRGLVGQSLDSFGAELVRTFDACCGEAMAALGYPRLLPS